MNQDEFLEKLKKIQTSADKIRTTTFDGYIDLQFTLNGISWRCSRSVRSDFLSVRTLKRDIPEKLLFKNIDIIKEHPFNKNTDYFYQTYIITPDDFFNKLKF